MHLIPSIKIQNFGPIKEGFTQSADGFFGIPRVSVLCGTQGSGKSSVAKLFSVCTWLEKALLRGDFSEKELTSYNRFVKNYCAYQNIHNYFSENTILGYKGAVYEFAYANKRLSITKKDTSPYARPKIMYIPAERNFMSTVAEPEKLKNLPSPLYTMLAEFDKARQNLPQKEVQLPIGAANFVFDRQNKISWIQAPGYRIRLQEASSGFQSLIPLVLVTRYLADSINLPDNPSRSNISLEESRKFAGQLEKIIKDQKLAPEVRDALIAKIVAASTNSRFINIVEEPEQNLYPSSQRLVLFELLANMNKNIGNSLLITTHSPFMISWLTLAIKAGSIASDAHKHKSLQQIVPQDAWISSSDVAVYQLSDNGKIEKLEDYKGLPSDSNMLNAEIAFGNDLFEKLNEKPDGNTPPMTFDPTPYIEGIKRLNAAELKRIEERARAAIK